jgi:hypothetical protein
VKAIRTDEVDRLFNVLGVEYWLGVRSPTHIDLRPRDLVHAKCSAYADRRLRASGWIVAREVEIGDARSRGWIDLLAYHPVRRLLLVIEVKTELIDIGALERTFAWYEREALAASRRLGWHPRTQVGAVLVLDSNANRRRIVAAHDVFARAFPGHAVELRRVVAGVVDPDTRRHLVLIDPRSRRSIWLHAAHAHGRRVPPAYENYAAALRALSR